MAEPTHNRPIPSAVRVERDPAKRRRSLAQPGFATTRLTRRVDRGCSHWTEHLLQTSNARQIGWAEPGGLASSEACRENRPDDEPNTPRRDHQGMTVRSPHRNPSRVTMSVTVSARGDSARAVAPTVAVGKAGVPSAHVNGCRAGCFEANWDPQRRPAQIRDRFGGAYSVHKPSPRMKRPPARVSSTTSSVRDLRPRPRELAEFQPHDGSQTPPSAIAGVPETAIVVKTYPRHRCGQVHAAESRCGSKPRKGVVRSEGCFNSGSPYGEGCAGARYRCDDEGGQDGWETASA